MRQKTFIWKRIASFILALAMIITLAPPLHAHAKEVTVLEGKVSINDTASSISESGGTVTITAKGSFLSSTTNNITIKNISSETATLSFSFALTGKNSGYTLPNSATSGTFSVMLAPEATYTMMIKGKSGLGSGTATLKLSSFEWAVAADSSNVTIEYDSTLGSVTAAGKAVNSGTTQEVSLTDGIALAATPKSGATFLGWVDAADGKILSTAATYTLKPAGDMTVKAAFATNDGTGTPWFGVGNAVQKSESVGLLGLSKLYYYTVGTSYLFNDLNSATAHAAANTTKAVVLMNSGTLPAGEYTIPSGVTLLIPFDSANTMYTTEAQSIQVEVENEQPVYTAPSEYRTLTLSDGAVLKLSGAMSVSAKHYYAQGSKQMGGSPTGPCGFVKMQGSSQIIVNNGGALYAYGYVTGSGSVVANSGATVYENFQIMDFRGGTQSTDMDNGVFPLSQYYVQNIEVPMTLYSGATEYAYTTIYMSSSKFGSAVAFIQKSGAMFNLTDGHVVKKYNGATDRLEVELYGTMTMSPINMTVGTSSINSKNYDLGINGNITLTIAEGSNATINQDLAFLPGSVVLVEAGAECELSSGINVYIYDADQWGGYCGPGNQKFFPVKFAPGRTYTRTASDLVDAKIIVNGTMDASKGNVYTTAGGANIISEGGGVVITKPGTQTVTYQLVQGTGYTEIPITPAKLKNGDGTYVVTEHTAGTYTYTNDVWVKDPCVHEYTENITKEATCTEPGEKTFTCKDTVNCGYSYTEVIPANGHTEVTDAAVAPTCTETGLTEGKHCSVCGTVTVAQTEVPALGHTPGAAADCENPQTCTVCGEELAPALGHKWTDADCDTPKTCSVCGVTEGEALGHSWTDATCTAPKTCSVCGETEGEALGHSWTDATCTDPKTCSVCGETEGEALGHSWTVNYSWADDYSTCTATRTCSNGCNGVETAEATVTKEQTFPPTCGDLGETTYTATFDVEWAKEQTMLGIKDIPATGKHTLGSETVTWNADHTQCTITGSCSVCHGNITVTTEKITSAEKTPATCTEKGWTTYTATFAEEWLVNKTQTKDVQNIPATGHPNKVHHEKVDATCVKEGTIEYWSCPDCGKNFSDEDCTTEVTELTIDIDPDNHDLKTTEAKAPTCTEIGWDEYVTCQREGCEYTTYVEKSALGHTWTLTEFEWSADGKTCTAHGKCACGETTTAAGTVSPEEKTPATCTEKGWTTYTADFEAEWAEDGQTKDVQDIPATGHSFEVVEAKAATCLAAGNEPHKHCTVCNLYFAADADADSTAGKTTDTDFVIAKKDHAYTYTADGWTITEVCNNGCNHSATITLVVPADVVYDGNKHEATVSGTIVGEYTLGYDADPVNAGTYTATLSVGEVSVTAEFTIAKAEPAYDVPTGLTAIYGQTLADVKLPDGWAWENSSASVGNAGNNQFTATFTPADTANYNSVTKTVTVTVSKAPTSVTTAPAAVTDLVYTGEVQALVTAGTANGGKLVYSLTENGALTETIPTGTNAGTYTVYYKVQGDDNHADSEVVAISVTIAKKTATITVGSHTVCVDSEQPGLTWTVEGLIGEDKLVTEPTLSTDAKMDITGEYTITASGADAGGNYTITYVDGKLTVREHNMQQTAAQVDPTCETAGKTAVYTCSYDCGHATGGEEIEALGHTYVPSTPVWSDDKSECTIVGTCSCGTTETETVKSVPQVTTEADCQTEQVTTYTATFTKSWITQKTVTTSVTGAKNPDKHPENCLSASYTYNDNGTHTYTIICECGVTTTTEVQNCTDKNSDNVCDVCEGNLHVCGAVGTMTATAQKDAKCTEAGHKAYWTCSCGKVYADDKATDKITDLTAWLAQGGEGHIPATDHAWTVSYEWSADGKSCTATRTCGNDATHNQSETVTATGVVTTPATCTEMGTTTYTANFDAEWAADGQTTTRQDVAAKDHAWTVSYEWSADGKSCTATRTCGNDAAHNQSETVTATGVVTIDPTCTEKGTTTYTANFNAEWAVDGQTTTRQDVAAKDHAWTVSYEWSADGKSCTATRTCGNDAAHNLTETVTATGVVTTPATCTEKGTTTYTANFDAEWAADGQTTTRQDVAAKDHAWTVSYEWSADGKSCTATRTCGNDAAHNQSETATATGVVTIDPTCTEKGTTTYTANFDAEWAADGQTTTRQDVAAKDHAWTVSYEWSADGKTCTATRICGNDADHNQTATATVTGEVTKAATCIAMGETTYTATFTADWAEKITKTVTDVAEDALNHASTEYEYVSNGEGNTDTHTKKHACCKAEVETVQHSYTNGKCVCDDVMQVTVTWKDTDGESHTVTVDYGGNATTTETPDVEFGYTTSWNTTVENVTEDVVIEVNREPKTFAIVFMAEGQVVKETTITYDTKVVTVEAPEKEGYDFIGWYDAKDNLVTDKTVYHQNNLDIVTTYSTQPEIAGTTTLTAKYQIKTYTITWNVDGNITTETYEHFQTPSYKESTDKVHDENYHYDFAGWDVDGDGDVDGISTVSGPVTYTAVYTQKAHTDTDGDGNHLCDYGCGKDLGETCDKESWTYTDNGDGTHDAECDACGDLTVDNAKHSYDETGKCICGNTAVAKIGDVFYCTLADAVAAAADGDTVLLVKSASGAGVVIDKDITIDLNDCTYTVNQCIGSAGTQTLGFQILKDNNVTIQNGTLAATTVTEGKPVKMLVQNYANLTLTDVTLDGTGSKEMQYVLSNNSGTVNITGATSITAPAGAVAFDVYDYSSAGYMVPTVNVNTTGKITGKIEVSESINENLNISGGTFTVEIQEDWCAEGFEPADNGNGTYGVKLHYVAEVKGEKYASLDAAVDAAADGDTVKLLGNDTGAGAVINKSITIDFGGYTYTVNSPVGSTGTETLGLQILSGNTVTLKNGTLTANEGENEHGKVTKVLVMNYANLNVENLELIGNQNTLYALSNNSGIVNITGATVIDGKDGVAFDVCKYANYTEPVVTVADTVEIKGKVEAVAKIGNTYYATLPQAVDAAKDGETVILVNDAAGAGVVIDKDITIDFDEHTYTFTDGVGSSGTPSNGFQILQGNDVTLKNGTLNVAEESKDKFYILVQNYADLTVEDMTLDGTNLDKWSLTDGDSYTLSNNSGNVNITGETKIIANDDGDLAYAFDVCKYQSYEAPVVNVKTTGKITGKIEVSTEINTNLNISGGTFTVEIEEDWCANGFIPKDNGDETYGVKPGAYVAQVNEGKKYETLAEAVAAAKAGETVKLLCDVVLEDKLTVETQQTWDFGEHIVTIASVNDNYGLVVKGDLTIESGKFVANGMYGIGVTGKLTVNGGNFSVAGANDYLIGNWGETVINGGTFNGQYCCVNNFSGTTGITGGSFTTEDTDSTGEYESCDLFANEGLTVTGGTFSKDVTEYCAEGYHTVDDDEDGIYTYGEHEFSTEWTTDNENHWHECDCGAISGEEVHGYDDDFDASCNTCDYERIAKIAVAVIGEQKFDSLEAAVAAAENGDIVKLLTDIALDQVITVSGKAVIITADAAVTITTETTDVFTVTAGGKLTLGENLTVSSNTSILWANGGTINVDGAVLNATNSPYTVAFADNGGEINIQSGTVRSSGSNSVTVAASGATVNISGGEVISESSSAVLAKDNGFVNISGGTVKTAATEDNYCAAFARSGGVVNVSGGQVSAANGYGLVAVSDGTVTVSGGKVAGVLAHENANAKAVISGGEITLDVDVKDGATMTVTGGTFPKDVTEYCAEGFHTVDDDEDGIYTYGEHRYSKTEVFTFCEEEGYILITCEDCGNTYDSRVDEEAKQYLIDLPFFDLSPKGHTAGEVVVENNVAPDCENAGSYDNVVYCTVCDAEISRETITVDALGHSYETVVTAPTCTEGGYTTYTCSVCGDSYVADEVEALGHTAGEAVVENNIAADCEKDGSYDNVVYCTVCGEEVSRETIVVDALGHTAGEAVVENEVAADCENDGSYDNVVYCSVCNEELSRETATIPALGHNHTKERVYTDLGNGYHSVSCGDCGDVITESEAHTYGDDHKCECGAEEVPAVTYVAEVNGEKYETLAEAVKAAGDGDTVKLLQSATGAGVVIDKDITIDLNDCTYTVNQCIGSAGTQTLGFQILKDNNVTIQNGTLAATTVTEGKPVKMLVQNYANLTLTDVTLDGTGSKEMQYVLSNNSGTVNIAGATSITAPAGAVAFDVYDYSSAGYTAPVVNVNTTGKINGEIEVSESINENLNISGGIFTVEIDEKWCAEGYVPRDNGDGTYGVEKDPAKPMKGDLDLDGDVDAADLTLLARHIGGIEILTNDVALYNADVDDDSDVDATDLTIHARYVGGIIKDWEAGLGEAAAADINGTAYATLAEAVEAAEDGDTVTLLADTSDTGVIIDKSITIDFGGHTYTFTEGVGSSGTPSNGFQILQGNDVTLKNGTLDVAAEAADTFYILVQNYANLTLEDMTLDGTNLDKWSLIETDQDSYTLSNNSGTVNITGETNIIANDDGDKAFAFDVCKFQSYEAPVVNVKTTGKITGAIEVSAEISTNLNISGGTFTVEIEEDWCAEGFLPKDNGDGTYTVEETPAVTCAAEVNGEMFETLAAAVAAAENGDIVKLLTDIALDQVITVSGKAVIITADAAVTITTETTDVFTVTAGGKLTLGKNLTVSSNTSILWANGGTINVDGAVLNATNSPYTVVFADNGGEINIQSGTVCASGSNSVTVAASGATVNISGGEVISESSSAVLAKDNGFVNISGGTVRTTDESDNYYCAAFARSGGAINVSGGEVEAAYGYGLVAVSDGTVTVSGGKVAGVLAHENANAKAVISGGEITLDVDVKDGATMTVTGGTFPENVTEYCAVGYECKDNGDGIYVVEKSAEPETP